MHYEKRPDGPYVIMSPEEYSELNEICLRANSAYGLTTISLNEVKLQILTKNDCES